MKFKILVVDDEQAARYGVRKSLTNQDNLVLEAGDLQSAAQLIETEKPDLVLLDINLPDGNGLEFLKRLSQSSDPPMTIMITAYGSMDVAVEAIKNGAFYYLTKPFEVEDLRKQVRNALENLALRQENQRLKDQLRVQGKLGQLIGSSPGMKKTFDLIEKISTADVTVLITGESGTGKEMVACEIHQRSARHDKPFVAMNCAAIPDNLIESELFGHEKGAFTGAAAQRRGKFELADEGTLFLDEIGDMSLGTQAKILRALETRTFERLGGGKPVAVNVRVISATHKNLLEEIRTGGFREDLYYRLRVVAIELPPLRKRKEDIPQLLDFFNEMFSAKHNLTKRAFSKDALARLVNYGWPGNVRELRNVVEQCVVLAPNEAIHSGDLPAEINVSLASGASEGAGKELERFREMKYEDAKALFEREYVTSILEENQDNISRAAEAMGIHRQTLQYKLKQLGIKRKWT